MDPLALIGWALVGGVAILIIGAAIAVAVLFVRVASTARVTYTEPTAEEAAKNDHIA